MTAQTITIDGKMYIEVTGATTDFDILMARGEDKIRKYKEIPQEQKEGKTRYKLNYKLIYGDENKAKKLRGEGR